MWSGGECVCVWGGGGMGPFANSLNIERQHAAYEMSVIIRYTLFSHSNINLQYDLFIVQSKQLHAYNSCEFLSYLQTM